MHSSMFSCICRDSVTKTHFNISRFIYQIKQNIDPSFFFFYKYTRICKNLMKIIFVRNRNKILDFSNKPHSPKGNDQSCVTVIYLIVVGFLNTKPILIFVLHCVFSDVFLFSKMIEHSIILLFSKSRSTETCSNRNYFDSFFYRNVRWWVFKHGHCAFKITKLS